MQAWAKTTDDKLRARSEAERHNQQQHAGHVAAWKEDKAKVEHAIANLKARAEFK